MYCLYKHVVLGMYLKEGTSKPDFFFVFSQSITGLDIIPGESFRSDDSRNPPKIALQNFQKLSELSKLGRFICLSRFYFEFLPFFP